MLQGCSAEDAIKALLVLLALGAGAGDGKNTTGAGGGAASIGDATAELILYNAGQVNGSLGGRVGADALCVAAANPNLNPNYTHLKAFISIQTGDAISDLPFPTTLPIKSESGTTIFTDRTDMLDGNNPATSLFAAGVTPTGGLWWSASDDNGGYNTQGGTRTNCNNFTTSASGEVGVLGDTDPLFPLGAEWINAGAASPCNGTRYLLCMAY